MPKRVLAITFVSAHEALYLASLGYCYWLGARGYETEVVNASAPGALKELLDRLVSEEFEFCFGIQGVGSNLAIGDKKIWSIKRTPFIGIHYDTPSSNIFNHANDSPYVANMYCFESMRDIHRRYIKTQQIVDVMPFQALSLPPEVKSGFKQRPVKLFFVKSGESLDECVVTINSLSPLLRAAVWRAIERAEKDPNLLLCDLVQDIFDRGESETPASFDLFWGILHWTEFYLRRKRAIDFVNWLKFQEGALIVGDGWDFIDKSGARAVFKPAMNSHEVLKLYGESQFICNTNPYGRDMIHERVVTGLISGGCAISDANIWWVQNFANVLALTLFDWNKPLDDQLKPVIDNIDDAEYASRTARAAALNKFTGQPQVDRILATVDAVRQFAERFDKVA